MYCRNCGKELNNEAAFCQYCGTQRGFGNTFCPNCATVLTPNAVNCPQCGTPVQFTQQQQQQQRQDPNIPIGTEQKSRLAAGLLGIFLGGFGVHNFYLGFTGKAIAQILLSCCGIGALWGLIEGILILVGTINKDARGIPLKNDV